MKSSKFFLIFLTFFLGAANLAAQERPLDPPFPVSKPTPKPAVAGTAAILMPNRQSLDVPRERREKAYAKLLEGQRHVWNLSNTRTQAGVTAGTLLATESIKEAVGLDPTLAEGYTALAELAYRSDSDEAIRLALIAVAVNPDNFGGHQILARLYTIKSRINRGTLDDANSALAIAEWKEIGRLDPRNAEAFAFLSEFYDRANRPGDTIDALKKWLSSATPIDSRFYRGVMQQDLSPESALVKLGAALFKNGETKESVEILSRAVADDPGSDEAAEWLSRAIDSADDKTAASAIESLQQAIFANPGNATLPVILAQISMRTGDLSAATKVLNDKIAELAEKDKVSASSMQMSLGDLYFGADRFAEAAASYERALVVGGFDAGESVSAVQSDFAVRVFEKVIRAQKFADNPGDVRKVIERSRAVLGPGDLFADKQLLAFYRETGQQGEALKLISQMRSRHPQDYQLIKLEASTMADFERVDEGVALIRGLIGKKPSETRPGVLLAEYDDFMNYLYISSLYSSAGRGGAAAEAANQAILAARNEERKTIGRLTLASALQTAGDFDGAENTLRDILRQSPGFPAALNNLGYFLIERNVKLDEALELILQAVGTDSTNPTYLDSLGWAYFKLGKFDEAEKFLQRAVRFSPGSSTIFEHLGDVREKLGNTESARSNWQKALRTTIDKSNIVRLKAKLRIK